MFTGQVICVNDGSTDGSLAILEQYEKKYLNVEIITQPNAGLSAARNSGIEIAQGEYIMFVDSDDYIEPNVLTGLQEQVERDKLDVLRYDFRNVNEKHEEFHPNKDPKRDVDLSETVVDGETFLNERLGPGCYAWQFILRRDLIFNSLTHSFINSFKEGIYFEDTEWTPRMLLRAGRVASTKKVVYNYLWRSGSITLPTDPAKRKKVIEDKIALIRGFKEQRKMVQDPVWFEWMTSFNTMTILNMLATMSSAERTLYLEELKSLRIFPLSIKREKMLSHKAKIILANISPSIYCNLMSLRR
jgi:glycosyltransferase involved in cell wall biosynthesis